MSKRSKLKEILDSNPVARQQAAVIDEAMNLVRQIRELGVAPHVYGLDSPFGDRTWLHRTARLRSN